MKLTPEISDANVVRAWEPGAIRVGDEWLRGHFILSPSEIIRDWAASDPATLSIEELGPALALEPEIVLLGTGARLTLPEADLMSALAERRIGLEIMDTPAACRTYNVLVHEHRPVVAALFSIQGAAR